jgi:DNA-binding NtrC family response regulator
MSSTQRPLFSRTVLTVDDDPDTLTAVHQHFVDRGFRSLVAVDGSEALRLIESDVYIDLLVSDFVLPGANGRSIIKIAEFYRPEIKVIVMSGQNRNTIPVELQSQLLQKPFSSAELDQLVSSVLS